MSDPVIVVVSLAHPTSWQDTSLAAYGPYAPGDPRIDELAERASSGGGLSMISVMPLRDYPVPIPREDLQVSVWHEGVLGEHVTVKVIHRPTGKVGMASRRSELLAREVALSQIRQQLERENPGRESAPGVPGSAREGQPTQAKGRQ